MPIELSSIGPYCTISSYTGFATRDDAYDVMLGLHHNAKLYVMQLCFLQPPTTADDDDFLDFRTTTYFSSTFSFSNL